MMRMSVNWINWLENIESTYCIYKSTVWQEEQSSCHNLFIGLESFCGYGMNIFGNIIWE